MYRINSKSGILLNTAFYKTGAHPWGLQAAMADEFEQFLDKNETLNIWSRGLYRPDHKMYSHKMISMIYYAIDDCLAVTKLARTYR